MATYPGGVYAPSAKSNGQVIQAAYFNDPETEITAVENALLNGIAHAVVISTGGLTVSTGGLRVGGPSTLAQVNAGASTVATLVVTGALSAGTSTLADLTVTGALSVGGIVFGGRSPSARVSLSANSTASSVAFAGISWNVEDHDSTGLHSTSVNSSRMNLTSSGLWLFGGQLVYEFNPASTMSAAARVVANDNEAVAGVHHVLTISSTNTTPVQFGGQYYATDTASYLTCQGRWSGAGTSSLVGSTGNGFGGSHFWVTKVTG